MANLLRRFHLPHPIVLLSGCVLLTAALSYVLPAGEFDRVEDEATGRIVVVPGTYHEVESHPVNLFEAFVALPKGMEAAADVIFLVFLVGGAFTVVDETGMLSRSIGALAGRLHDRGIWIIPIVSLVFAVGGAVENMSEEIIALTPVLLILCRRVGFTPMVAVAVSVGAAAVGSAFSPVNPFQVQIAQRIADVPLGSGASFRMVLLMIGLTFWIGWTMRYASRTRTAVEKSEGPSGDRMIKADWLILALIGVTFVVVVLGMFQADWGFNELSAAFFIMGIVVGAVGGLGVGKTAVGFARGFREMAYAAMLIGFARAIFVVLDESRTVDTIVNALFTPLQDLPLLASSVGMVVAQALIHFPVNSVSGQAVLTMPVLAPLSDLLGLSRQIAVLAYQTGAGLTDLMTPTNGTLMAVIGLAGIEYEKWFSFAIVAYLALIALGILAIALGIAIGF